VRQEVDFIFPNMNPGNGRRHRRPTGVAFLTVDHQHVDPVPDILNEVENSVGVVFVEGPFLVALSGGDGRGSSRGMWRSFFSWRSHPNPSLRE
jgi:hypothetical protein